MPRVPLNMPKMSMTMEFGTVEHWLVEVGGAVTDGDPVVVVTTDKVDMDVESNCDGTLVEILAQSGDEVPVGQPIGWIETEKDDLLGDLFAAPDETDSRHPEEQPPRHPGLAPGSPADGAAEEIPASAGMTGEAPGMTGEATSAAASRRGPSHWPASWPPRPASTWPASSPAVRTAPSGHATSGRRSRPASRRPKPRLRGTGRRSRDAGAVRTGARGPGRERRRR
ncbi:MAG: biotin/lipoyl-containing protein [Micropruina sp.]